MINSKDVRYGNLIFHIIRKKNQKVTFISAGQINGIHGKYFDGIPLSPDILEKCGFETVRGNLDWYYIKIGYMEISVNIIDYQIAIDTPKGQVMFYKFESLHGLQNLIYILSGTELTITL